MFSRPLFKLSLRLALPAALVATTLVTVTGSSVTAAPEGPKLYHPAGPPARAGKAAVPEFESNSVMVKFSRKATSSARAKMLNKVNARKAAGSTGDYATVTSSTSKAPELLKQLKADPSVELASLNYVRSASTSTPNDEYYGPDQAHLRTIRMPAAWDLSKSAVGQTVAVLDTGVDGGHPDLTGRVFGGYNTVQPGQSSADNNGHGTVVAGIIAANTNNRIGIAGVAWNARILPIKVLDSGGNGTDTTIINGINLAVQHGARVINMSLSGPGHNPVLQDAIKKAVAKGVVVVAAAGNEYNNVTNYPAAYPEVIAVGATDNNGAKAAFSSYGDWVDVAAPGWNILSTGPRALTPAGYLPYWYKDGTSFSTPMVAGVAAMMRNRFPSYTPAQIAARIKATARDAGPRGLDPYYGAGLLDANEALGGSWAPELWSAGPDGNDVPARATALSTSAQGTIGPEGDEDWYRIAASPGRKAIIRLTSPPYDEANRPQNLDGVLHVYNEQLQLIGYSDEPGAPELIELTQPTGAVYVRVVNYNASRDSRPYTVSVATGGAGGSLLGERFWVRDTSPVDLAGGVSRSVSPSITFSADIDPASISATTVKLLHGKTGAVIPSVPSYDPATKKLTVNPTPELQDNTPYRVFVGGLKDTAGETWAGGYALYFRTVDAAPGPISNFTLTGGYTTAAMKWTLPGITDLDQVVIRREAGTTPPAAPNVGTKAYHGPASSATATGLANATTYTFRAWVKDRKGSWSSSVQATLVGTSVSMSGNKTVLDFGGSVSLSGKVVRVDTKAPLAGVAVSLYGRNKNGTTWREIARRTTGTDGSYSLTYQPPASTVFVWGYNGSSALLGSRTGNWTVDVRPTITANVSPTAIKLGATANFYGYVRPQHAGTPVYLQRLSGSTWSTITSVKLNSTGNYAFGIKPTTRGTYTYRVAFNSDGDHATAVSPARSFTVG